PRQRHHAGLQLVADPERQDVPQLRRRVLLQRRAAVGSAPRHAHERHAGALPDRLLVPAPGGLLRRLPRRSLKVLAVMNCKQFARMAAAGLGAAWLGDARAQDGPPRVDPGLKPYRSTGGIAGNANSVGSDTLANLMTYWAETFKKTYPSV